MNPMQLLGPRALLRGLAATVVLGALLVSGCGQSITPTPKAAGTTVNVAAVEASDVMQFGEYTARVQSSGAVALRAQVGGTLQARLYQEGQFVEKGQTLFEIDPEPYALALRRAEAELAEARAQHRNAQREWNRQQDLFARKVNSEHDKDAAETALEAAAARERKAEAAADDARRMLGYARVKAPVAGIVGLEALAEGNLVEPGSLLTTITPLDPIYVHFSLPSSDATLRRAAFGNAEGAHSEAALIVGNGRIFRHKGQVNFTDARIDPLTDSVRMRAVFPNPDAELLPGEFVRLKLPLREFRDAVLIDPTAVTEGPAGPQVFTINHSDPSGSPTALSHSVVLGPVLNGRQLVLSGLSAGSQLVVNGQVSLRLGSTVVIAEGVADKSPAQDEGLAVHQRTQAGR